MLNTHLLVSDARHFRVDYEINPYMSVGVQPDGAAALVEHERIVNAHHAAGRTVEYLPAAEDCPDMVFTANCALVCGDVAVLGRPPFEREPEIQYFRSWFTARGYTVLEAPFRFSGQGDALNCGDRLLVGHGQRTDPRMVGWLTETLGVPVLALRTSSSRFYDLDLAVGVVAAPGADSPGVLAFCPAALDTDSVRRLRCSDLTLIEVDLDEASEFACNLISDGVTVTMCDRAPKLAAELSARGLRVTTLSTTELAKGGGGVRCTALSLSSGPRPWSTVAGSMTVAPAASRG